MYLSEPLRDLIFHPVHKLLFNDQTEMDISIANVNAMTNDSQCDFLFTVVAFSDTFKKD